MKKETKIFLFRLTILLFISLFACSLTSCKEVKIDNSPVLNFNRNSEPNLQEAYQEYLSSLNNLNNVALEYRLEVERGNIYEHQEFISILEKRLDNSLQELQEGVYTQIKILKDIPDNEVLEEPLDSMVKAFPNAKGYGAFARADVDYELYEVTNLNASGAGSFWSGLGNNRIIVFKVSGIIDLGTLPTNTRSFKNCIVLGQTAPKGGITLVGNGWKWNGVENVVFRYLRFRTWQCRSNINSPCGVDAIDVFGLNGKVNSNLIFDHCSFAFGGDETLSFRGDSHTITVQNCIFSYGKTGMLAGDSDDTSRGYNFSILDNFWTTVGKRTPNSNSNGNIDKIGNVTYNILNQLDRTGGNVKLNEIGNAYTGGARNRLNLYNNWQPKIYTSNNRYSNKVTENGQDNTIFWANWINGRDPIASDFVNKPYKISNYDVLPDGDDAIQAVSYRKHGCNSYLDNNGNPVFQLDKLDLSAYNEFDSNSSFDWTDGVGSNRSQGNWKYIPQRQWLLDNQNQFGIIKNEHNQKTHIGVVPKSWILKKGLNVNTFNPLSYDLSFTRTNIEMYSFEVDK